MKLLITGASGLLGSACVREFSADHKIVTCTGVELRHREATRDLFNVVKPDLVIHCAAKVGGVKANKENPVEFMLDNLAMQNNVIEAAHDSGVQKLCFVGTSCMFPRDAKLPVQECSLFTGRFEDSVEAYAIAKIAGWRLCKAYWDQYGDNFITVAPSNIYGPGDNYGPDAHVIPALIKKFSRAVENQEPFEVWGNGFAVREFIYVDDVARAIRLLLEHWKTPNIVNIGTGQGTSIAGLIKIISESSPYFQQDWPRVVWNESEPTGIPRKTFDTSHLEKLGWKPEVTLEEGMKRTWDSFMNGDCRNK